MNDSKKSMETHAKENLTNSVGMDIGHEKFKIGRLLKKARIEVGLTQEQVAAKLHTKKSAISRIENHSEDIRLSTLENFAKAVGKSLRLEVV